MLNSFRKAPASGGRRFFLLRPDHYPRFRGLLLHLCTPMQRTLSEHIGQLEAKIVALRGELQALDLGPFQRTERELALMNAEEALNLFKRAYEVEKRVPK